MVCEKNKETAHDFLKDPIEIIRDGNVLMANGTTLGADNGIAVATNLAIMENRSLEHGPLELLFTVDEETGLTGAANLGADFLESRTLLNLDSEEEGALYVGCSGGKDTIGYWKLHFDAANSPLTAVRVRVAGMKGGHSGLDIDKGRGNAVKIMNRVLLALDAVGARLSFFDGGNKHNAIPRECETVLLIPTKNLEHAEKIASDLGATVKAELSVTEPELVIDLNRIDSRKKWKVVRRSEQQKLIKTIAALPHGVIKMSPDIPGLVQTSTNLATVETTDGAAEVGFLTRSALDDSKKLLTARIARVAALAGFEARSGSGYPGWRPEPGAALVALVTATYQECFGEPMAVKAMHAGLECGIFKGSYPSMEMVSFGPSMWYVHTPDERVSIPSVQNFWRLLEAVLEAA